MKVFLRSGEIYNFYNLQWKKDNEDYIALYGNFKPRGKYKELVLPKRTIVNLHELEYIPDYQEPYFCPRCARTHRMGRIYEKHKKFLKVEIDDSIPSDKILNYNPRNLRDIAIRQIKRLQKRIRNADENWKSVYTREINRTILHEREWRLKNI